MNGLRCSAIALSLSILTCTMLSSVSTATACALEDEAVAKAAQMLGLETEVSPKTDRLVSSCVRRYR